MSDGILHEIWARDASGAAHSGVSVTFKKTGTSTDQAPFTDRALTVPAANPGTTNAAGYLQVYLDPANPVDISYTVDGVTYQGTRPGTFPTTDTDASTILSRLLTVDGSGSGLDADLLDGNEAGAFVLKAGDTMTGDLSIEAALPQLTLEDSDGTDQYTQIVQSGGTARLRSRDGASDGVIIFSGHGGGVDTEYARFSAAGAFTCQDIYDATTAAAANMNVTTAGRPRRSTSAAKYKSDIEPIDLNIAYDYLRIADESAVWYRSNTDLCKEDNPAWGHYGSLADGFEEKFPQLVHFSEFVRKPFDVERFVPEPFERGPYEREWFTPPADLTDTEIVAAWRDHEAEQDILEEAYTETLQILREDYDDKQAKRRATHEAEQAQRRIAHEAEQDRLEAAFVPQVEGFAYERTTAFHARLLADMDRRLRALEQGTPKPDGEGGDASSAAAIPVEIADIYEAHGGDPQAVFERYVELGHLIQMGLASADDHAMHQRLTPHVPWLKQRGAVEVV
ncbi:MAG: hypothetical protein AAGF20_00050 [Pseudomonadota bacterium]